jgi:hypothetical protein
MGGALSAFVSTRVCASPLACADLQTAYQADRISEEPYVCSPTDGDCGQLQKEQLHAAVALLSGRDIRDWDWPRVVSTYAPAFKRIDTGMILLDAVNIDLGDNPLVAFFLAGTVAFTGIRYVAGVVSLDGTACPNVAFRPIIKAGLRRALCDKIVPKVRVEAPRASFSPALCLSAEQGVNVSILDFDRDHLSVRVQRNLSDVGAWYLNCTATVNRVSSEITDLSCDVRP